MGDNGEIRFDQEGVIESMISTDLTSGDDDTINLDIGSHIAIGGAGADTITAGYGDDDFIGDNGEIIFTNGAISSMTTSDIDGGTAGADTIDAGFGDNRVLAGLGTKQVLDADNHPIMIGDSVVTGDDTDIVLGDNGSINYSNGALNRSESSQSELGDNDS